MIEERYLVRPSTYHIHVRPHPIEQWGASTGASLPYATSRQALAQSNKPWSCRPLASAASFPAGWLMADPPLHFAVPLGPFPAISSSQLGSARLALGSAVCWVLCWARYHRPCRCLPTLRYSVGWVIKVGKLSADCLLHALLHTWASVNLVIRVPGMSVTKRVSVWQP